MIGTILSLFGFGPSEVQGRTPPLFAYLLAVPTAIFAAEIVEAVTFFVSWLTFGYATRWWVSVVFRAVGVLGTLVWAQAAYRVIVHRDDHSWAGFVRKMLLRP